MEQFIILFIIFVVLATSWWFLPYSSSNVFLDDEIDPLYNRTKKEIEEIARARYGIELDRRKTKDNMIAELKEKLS